MNADHLLEVSGLKTHFFTEEGIVRAVDGVDFYVDRGEVLGLVGESGCGKSVTSHSILRLVDEPGEIVAGEVKYEGKSLLDLSEVELQHLRGSEISMIFQQPQSSLNPLFKIGRQVAEVFRVHQGMGQGEAWERAVKLLGQVGLPDPAEIAHSYPHEISGGQAQRVMIATALALDPKLLIADEPTTALDVTIQAQILDLIRDLSRRRNTAVILITHDLGVVAEMCDRVAVMYAGQIVEQAPVRTLFNRPLHPYSQGLVESIPVLGEVKDRLEDIPGVVPDPVDLGPGCRFAERCRARVEYDCQICEGEEPELIEAAPGQIVRCWLYRNDEEYRGYLRVTQEGIVQTDRSVAERDQR